MHPFTPIRMQAPDSELPLDPSTSLSSEPTNVVSDTSSETVFGGARTTQDAVSDTIDSALVARNRQLDRQVRATLAQRKEEDSERRLPEFQSYQLPALEADLYAVLQNMGYQGGKVTLSVPPAAVQEKQGFDLACNLASVAKDLGRNPVDFTTEVARQFSRNHWVNGISTAGPFLNVHLNHRRFASDVITQIRATGEHYGSYNEGAGKVVLVDYSSPNMAKNMTVAHLRSTIIGHSLSKLHEAAGFTAFRVNHLGDWGTQIGKIIYQYRKELEEQGEAFLVRLQNDMPGVLLEIYRTFVRNAKEDEALDDQAREIFLQLEKKDPECIALWEKFLECSIKEFNDAYQRLGVTFDAMQGESFYDDRMAETVEEAVGKNVLKRNDEDAVVFPGQPLYDPANRRMNDGIMKDQEGMYRDEVILKPSGGTVYLTRDLAAIRYRTQELNADKILYVIGKEQQKHCLMLFAMAEQLGYIERGQAEHISFGHLTVSGRKMSGRHGEIALLNDVLDESIQAADAVARERNENDEHRSVELKESEVQAAATKIGMSAVIFNDLRQDRLKDIEFSPMLRSMWNRDSAPTCSTHTAG